MVPVTVFHLEMLYLGWENFISIEIENIWKLLLDILLNLLRCWSLLISKSEAYAEAQTANQGKAFGDMSLKIVFVFVEFFLHV